MPNGFTEQFEKAVLKSDFPIELSDVRLASNPLEATAKGALIAALTEN
jgi:hypothetical protein